MTYTIRYDRNSCIGSDSCQMKTFAIPLALGMTLPSRCFESVCSFISPQHFKVCKDGKPELIGGYDIAFGVFEKELPDEEFELAKIVVKSCPERKIQLLQDGKEIECK